MITTYLAYWMIVGGKPQSKEFTTKLEAYKYIVTILETYGETVEVKLIPKRKVV